MSKLYCSLTEILKHSVDYIFSSPDHKVRECVNFFIQTTSSLKPLIGFLPNFTERIPVWSPTKDVQTVSIGCISRSWGQNTGFQNAT